MRRVLHPETAQSQRLCVSRERQKSITINNQLFFNELHVAKMRQREEGMSGNDNSVENGRETQKTKNPAEAGFKIGRRERIRTSDPLVPNQLRYQAALLADVLLFLNF